MHLARLALLLAAVSTATVLAPFAAAGGAPAVTGVEVTSEPRADATYALGETIEVTVRFSEAVDVTGAPRLAIDMDPASWGEKRAAYASGSGTATLVFAHRVVEPNYSTRGIAVLGNTLSLNGGAIRSASSQAEAALAHTGLPHDAAHKVDWRLSAGSETLRATTPPRPVRNAATAPAVTGVEVTSEPRADATYALGETIEVTVRFSEAVGVTGAPGLAIDMDPASWGEKRVAYARGSGTASLVFAHAVVEPNYSPRGIAVLADTLALNGGSIRSASSGTEASLTHVGLPHDAAHKVDWRLSRATAASDTTPPELVSGEVDGSTMRLTFSEALDADATGGRFMVDLATEPLSSAFHAAGAVTVEGAVVTVELGAGKPRAEAGRLVGNRVTYIRRADGGGGALRDLAGNPVAAAHVMPYGGVETWRGSEEWRYVGIALDNVTQPPPPPPDTTPPELVRGEIDGGTVTLWFSEALDPEAKAGRFHVQVQPAADRMQSFDAAGAVAIDGNRVTVGVGAGKPRARAGMTELNYAHYLAPLDPAARGLRDLAGNPVATPLAFHGGERGTRSVKLDNVTPPAVTGVEVTSEAGDDDTYALRDVVRVTVTFSEAVAVTGAPRVKLALGAGDERWATYRRGSGTAALAFAWTVAQGDASSAGVAVLANTLALNGGTIRGVGSGRDAALAHGGRAPDAAHKVDGALPDTTPPRLSRTVVDGAKLTLAFTEAIDDAASPANGAFTVKKTPPGGTEETVGLSGSPAVDGAQVTLTLAQAVRGADTGVKVSYRKSGPDARNRLRDVAGNEVAEFSDKPVANSADTTPPWLVGGEIDGGTMTLYFSEPLDPHSVGGVFRVSVLHTDGQRYTTNTDGDVEINGNAVTVGLGSPIGDWQLRAKAGGINSAFYGRYTDPTVASLRDLAGNPVRTSWRNSDIEWTQIIALDNLTGPPAVSGVWISSDAGADRTNGPGDTIRVRLSFSASVAVTGAPRLKIDFSSRAGDEKWAAYASGSGTRILEFAYTVARGDGLSAGVAVLANTLELHGGTIESAAAPGESATLAHRGRPHNASHKVDARPPTLFLASVNGATLRLTFDEALGAAASLETGVFTVKKTPQGEGSEQNVSLSGSPAISGATVTLTLADAVLATDTNVKVSYARPTSGTGNRLRDAAGNEVAGFTDELVKNVTGDTTPPRLERGEIDGGAVTLYFSEALDPDSTGGWYQVDVGRRSGWCRTVAESAVEIDGSTVTVGLGGGCHAKAGTARNTLWYGRPTDGATGLRDLAGNEVGDTPRIALHNVTGVALAVTGLEVSSDAGDDATYGLGDTIRVRLTFSKTVNVTGAPQLKLDFSSETGDERWAEYASGSGTQMLEFAYTVAEGDTSGAGVAVLADTLTLNGGTIQSASAAGESAKLAHASLPYDPSHKVDTASPTLSEARVDETTLTLTFDEPLGAAALLANGAFTVKRTPQGSTEETVDLGGTPAIDGATVALTLANTVLETDTDVKVSYTKPTSNVGNRLRDEAGNEVASFSDQPVTYMEDITPPRLVRGEIDGGTITLYFSEPLNEDCVGGAFRVEVRPSTTVWTSFVATGDVKISGNVVTVGVGEGKPRTNAGLSGNRLFYFLYGNRANWLQDLAGNLVSTALRYGGLRATQKIDLDNVTGVARLSVADARANEGAGVSVGFEVSLSSAATDTVTVDYATADGTATAGADYTATSGTLTFAAGEKTKTVSVPVLDDAVDEGEETFVLRLSNVQGARAGDLEATGTIANDDPLQKMWLSRFGRTVADHVTGAVSDRLANPLSGAQVTVAGQRVDLAQAEDGAALTQALTGLARALGASEQPAPGDGPDGFGAGPGSGSGTSGWPGTAMGVRGSSALDGTTARFLSGRELLLGSAFHLAREGDGTGPGLAAWGRVTFGGFDGEERADAGSVRIDSEVTTGILGADAEWNRLLAGVAISVSEGEGTFDQPGVDSGKIESSMTTVSPYARFMVTDRVSVWGLAGWGTGDMTIVQAANENTGQPERITRTDLSMRLAALGGRGALLTADANGGFDLALKGDAFFVETTSEAVSNEGDTSADASRVRLALEGSRAFQLGGSVLTPGLELGLRHDGGDAETGTGVELGGRVAWTDAASGLSVEANVRALIAHEDSGYEEWGASGALRLAPGAAGRGLSFILAPTYGAPSSGVERLWSARDARGLSPGGGTFEPSSRLEGELGYGIALSGGFTGIPNVGFVLASGARDYRLGWRLAPAGAAGFEVNLDATRRESANLDGADTAPVEHEVLLRGALRW